MPECAQKRNRGLFLAAIRPMRQLSERYAQALRAPATGLRGADSHKTNGRRCEPVAKLGVALLCVRRAFGGSRAAFQPLLLDKWGHFRSKVGFKPGFLRLAV